MASQENAKEKCFGSFEGMYGHNCDNEYMILNFHIDIISKYVKI